MEGTDEPDVWMRGLFPDDSQRYGTELSLGLPTTGKPLEGHGQKRCRDDELATPTHVGNRRKKTLQTIGKLAQELDQKGLNMPSHNVESVQAFMDETKRLNPETKVLSECNVRKKKRAYSDRQKARRHEKQISRVAARSAGGSMVSSS